MDVRCDLQGCDKIVIRDPPRSLSDTTIQAILDAAPSDEARKVLLSNPNMMKALLRRASRHTNTDGAADTSIFKRIFADEVFNSPPDLRNLRQREDRLHDEMKRAQEAELRLLEAQAKVNQLILEKQKANMVAEQSKEEAKRIQMRLELIRQDIDQRNDAMKRLEEDYDKLDQEAARIRSENYKLKLKEAHAAGRAEGRNEGRTAGRKEGEQRGYEEGYGAGFALGSRDMADKLMKYLDEDDLRLAHEEESRRAKGHSREASSSSQGPPVPSGFQELRDPGRRSSERGRDREKERRPERSNSRRQPTMPVPSVQVQAPSVSTDQSPPPQMPEPVVPPPHSPSPPPKSVTPTPAQQIIRDYHESPERFEPPIPIRNASPKPPIHRNPLPDSFIPVVSENDPDGLMFDMPAAHEFAATPSATAQPLPSQASPRRSPQMFSREALAPQNTGSNIPAFVPHQNTGSGSNHMPFIPPTRDLPQPTPKTKSSSSRSRDYRQGRSDSPDRSSTPLSEMSLLQRQASEDESGIVMPYTYQMLKRNHSVLSVIQEQSDTDGTSPVAQRMNSQSPGMRRPQYEAAPMQIPTPTLSYIPAPLDGSMGVGHPPPHDDPAHYPPPMIPNPGQPRVRQFDEARQRQAATPSPVMPTYAVAPLPEGPISSFIPNIQAEVPMPTPFVPPQNKTPEPILPPPPQPVANISRSSTKKGKKDKKRSQEPAVPEVQIIPPSDKSESSYNRLSQVDIQPQEQPPQLDAEIVAERTPHRTPQRSPMRMPVPLNTVNSDSEDSTAGRRPPPIAPQPPPPPAFVPKTAPTPPPAHVPFIPPPPVVAKPPTPPPVIPVATGTSRKSSKKGKGRSRQQAPVVPPSPVRMSTPITMPDVVQAMPTVTGEVVMELPADATIASIAPGTVLSPVMAHGTGMYEPPPITAFVPPSPGRILAPTPRVPRSPGLPVLSKTPSPTPSRTPEVQPVVPAVASPPAISAVPSKNPKGFVPKAVDQPVDFGYRTPRLGPGRHKAPLGRPNPTAAYSLTSRTPRLAPGMTTGDGLPAVTPEPGPSAHLPVVPPSVSSSSPMAPPGAFDGEPVVPHLTGSQQYTGSRQHTGSQYPGSRQPTGSQQYGMPQQHTGSQQYGMPQQHTGSQQYGIPQQPTGSQPYAVSQQSTGSQQYGVPQQYTGAQQYAQYEVPQQYTGAQQYPGSQQHTGSQQYSSSRQHSGSQSYTGWGRMNRPGSSEPHSPFVPPLDQMPASTPYVTPVNLVRPHPSPRHSPNRQAPESELTSPVVPPSETYSSRISAAPVQQPGPGPKKGFVPPSAALKAATGKPKIARPRGNQHAMPLTGRVYKNGPLTMANPDPQPVAPPSPVVPEPQPVEPEQHPEVPTQT
ncbi:hypothetical protein FRC01_004512, partial [Tulasnella sp. 417]